MELLDVKYFHKKSPLQLFNLVLNAVLEYSTSIKFVTFQINLHKHLKNIYVSHVSLSFQYLKKLMCDYYYIESQKRVNHQK